MVTLSYVEEQLKRIGCNFKFWGRPEIRELAKVLMPDEIIAGATNGRYEGGFALLCVTSHRLLLVDRKPLFLTLEDIRFDMIAEINFNARLLDSTIRIMTPNRTLAFTGYNQHRIRNILNYTQQKVMEIRQHYLMGQFQQQPAVNQRGAAPIVGGLVMRGSNQGQQHHLLPLNPYTRVPILMRRRLYPKFY
ncbi:MAG TPA: PH domain-containing protein [Candidatus Saccharimonadales bacterium]|nr:PH domain-containing protein [Candidatus Saccharimonadales bacterium]